MIDPNRRIQRRASAARAVDASRPARRSGAKPDAGKCPPPAYRRRLPPYFQIPSVLVRQLTVYSRSSESERMMRSGRIVVPGGSPRPSASCQIAKMPKSLRSRDLPFEVVAHHPGLVGLDLESFHRVQIGPLLGLAEPALALDLDVVEPVCEFEPFDLGALRVSRAVGDQRQEDALCLSASTTS